LERFLRLWFHSFFEDLSVEEEEEAEVGDEVPSEEESLFSDEV